jgi:post-segregation antitoxin (ccd killing protein)
MKLKTFRLSESSLELLNRAKKNNIPLSRFVREVISEKFERDYTKWIEEQADKNNIQLPF